MIRPGKINESIALVTKGNTLTEWHKRLAHINVHKIIQMSRDGILPKIKVDYDPNNFFCEGCVKGKMCSRSFKTAPPRKVKVGEAIHCDLQGPMPQASINGNKYALVIKDEASSYRSIYFQKFKSDTYDNLDKFIEFAEKMTGNEVKSLRSDNGKEFIDSRVTRLLTNKNITHELSAPHVPQQNGRIERENRTISELARTMMLNSNLPEFLWAEAMNTAVYVFKFNPR